MAADISKMFREVGLQDREKDFHRFLQTSPDGDFRMTRLTFGVAPLPYLATQVLLQLAEDHGTSYPVAAKAVKRDFYVDDLLTGAQDLPSAEALRVDVNNLLHQGCMILSGQTRHPSCRPYQAICVLRTSPPLLLLQPTVQRL